MEIFKFLVALVFICSLCLTCTESRRGGDFRGGSRSRSRWFSSSSSSRRSHSVPTSRPSIRHSFNNYDSSYNTYNSRRTAAETVTSRSYGWDTYSSNGYGSNSYNSRRTAAETATSRSYGWDTYSSNGYGSNSYGSNGYNSNRKYAAETATVRALTHGSASKVHTTSRNYVQNHPETPGSSSTFYSGSSTYRHHHHHHNIYRNRYNNTKNEQVPPHIYYNNYYNSYYGGDKGSSNPLLAGLGGSALGMYLGYQIGSMSNNYHPHHNYGSGYHGYSDYSDYSYPRYSVVHHYHHGGRIITKDTKVESKIITHCNNITFCTSNTQPLCLTNGTIYCLAPISTVSDCTVNSTRLQCVNSTLTIPCFNSTDTGCNNTTLMKTERVQIPCVTNLHVVGDFATGKLTIKSVEKRSVIDNPNPNLNSVSDINNIGDIRLTENLTTVSPPRVDLLTNETVIKRITEESSTSVFESTTNLTPETYISDAVNTTITPATATPTSNGNIINRTATTESLTVNVTDNKSVNSTVHTNLLTHDTTPVITSKGIVNQFCVTVIADPIPEPKKMTNEEFLQHLRENNDTRNEMYRKFEKMLNDLLS